MTTPADDNRFLHGLELDVEAELTLTEARRPERDPRAPVIEDLLDPDAERYEVSLRTLLGAVEAVADGSHPGEHADQEGRHA